MVVLIMGILGALGLAGLDRTLMAVFDGQRNLELTQKAEMTLQRLLLEMRFVERTPDTRALRLDLFDGGTRAVYVSKRDGQEHTLQFAGSLLTLDAQPLADEVQAFTVASDGMNSITLTLGMAVIGDFTVEVYP